VRRTAARLGWFEQALEKLAMLGLESVAFPHSIGCGLAGGDWAAYRAAIERFAVRNPAISVVVVRLRGEK